MYKLRFFAKIIFVVFEVFLIIYGKVAYDFLKDYEDVTWTEVLLSPEKYQGKSITVSGKIFRVHEGGTVIYIHQERTEKNSGEDVWVAFLGRRVEGSGITGYSDIKIFGKFLGIESRSLLPVIKVHRYEKLKNGGYKKFEGF